MGIRSSKDVQSEFEYLESEIARYEAKKAADSGEYARFYQKEICKLYRKLSATAEKLCEILRREAREEAMQEAIQYAILEYDAYFHLHKHFVVYPNQDTKDPELVTLYIFCTMLVADGVMPSCNKDRVIKAFNAIGHIKK